MKTIRNLLIAIIILFPSGLIYSQKQIKDSLKNAYNHAKHDTTRCKLFLKIGDVFENENPDSAIFYYNRCLQLAEKKELKILQANALRYIGLIHFSQSNYDNAIKNFLKSLKIAKDLQEKATTSKEKIEIKKGISSCYINMGLVNFSKGNYDKAIELYIKSLKISEEIVALCKASGRGKEGENGLAVCYTNIGLVHYYQGSFDKAIEYYTKALKIDEDLGDIRGIASDYGNIGIVYFESKNYDKAIEYYLKSLKINEEIGDKKGMSGCYTNIGGVYCLQNNYTQALEYCLKSLKIAEEMGDQNGIIACYNDMGLLNISLADSRLTTENKRNAYLNKAIEYSTKAYQLAHENNTLPNENDAAKTLLTAYKKLGNYKKAIEFSEIFIATKDSMFKEEKTKSIANAEKKFQAEKKQLEIEKLNKEKELQQSELLRQQETGRRQKLIIGFTIFGLLLTGAFAVFIVQRLRITRRQKLLIEQQKLMVDEKNILLNQQNEEITAQRDEIEAQRDEITAQRDLVTLQRDRIEEQKQEITDSINYAKRIQHAVLPSGELASNIMGNHFILFKPKDIVSGDFYWAARINELLIITTADCTGHGVPGAFMSMLGVSFINEIVRKKEITKASDVLDNLRQSVIEALQQKGNSEKYPSTYSDNAQHESLRAQDSSFNVKDGMDIVFCVLNMNTLELQYSGANNPLYIIRNKKSHVENDELEKYIALNITPNQESNSQELKFYEIKPDKMPVAIFEEMRPYTNHKIQLQKDDCIYLISDGYESQFGGPKNKMFMAKQLKELLINNADRSMAEQHEILDQTFENWKGNNEQIDDVTILGIQI